MTAVGHAGPPKGGPYKFNSNRTPTGRARIRYAYNSGLQGRSRSRPVRLRAPCVRATKVTFWRAERLNNQRGTCVALGTRICLKEWRT
jgi:hypothetical protein